MLYIPSLELYYYILYFMRTSKLLSKKKIKVNNHYHTPTTLPIISVLE